MKIKTSSKPFLFSHDVIVVFGFIRCFQKIFYWKNLILNLCLKLLFQKCIIFNLGCSFIKSSLTSCELLNGIIFNRLNGLMIKYLITCLVKAVSLKKWKVWESSFR